MRNFEGGLKKGLALTGITGALFVVDAARTGPKSPSPEAQKNLLLNETAVEIGRAAICSSNISSSEIGAINPSIVVYGFLAQEDGALYKVFAAISKNRPVDPQATQDVEVISLAKQKRRMIKIISSRGGQARTWMAQEAPFVPTGDPYSQENPASPIGPIVHNPDKELRLAREAWRETQKALVILDMQVPSIGLPGC